MDQGIRQRRYQETAINRPAGAAIVDLGLVLEPSEPARGREFCAFEGLPITGPRLRCRRKRRIFRELLLSSVDLPSGGPQIKGRLLFPRSHLAGINTN